VLDEVAFGEIIGDAVDFVDKYHALMTIGITPSRPETGYGYIQRAEEQTISRVKCFTEKPNLELAQTFIQCGEFFWNSGIFIWKIADIIDAIEKYLPEHHSLFDGITDTYGTEAEAEAITDVFAKCRAISIDYGVMEKADNVFVRCGDFGWSDVGTWGSLYQHSRKDKYANVKPAEGCYTYDTRNSIISLPQDKIAVINGLRDYIVVDTDDVLMICPRSEEQNIKKYIDEVKFNNGDTHC
jgi:mannose-1-phosphate guanylyltransferase